MRTLLLIIFSKLLTAQPSPTISVTCEESEDVIPPEWIEIPQASPSLLLALKVAVLPEDFGAIRLNISWAINIDQSIRYLTGTWITIDDDAYRCRYEPPFIEVDLSGLEQLWFYYLAPAEPGLHLVITAYNLPNPADGEFSKFTTCNVPYATNDHTAELRRPTSNPTVMPNSVTTRNDDEGKPASLLVVYLGCLAGLVALVACSLTLYQMYGMHSNSHFTELPKATEVTVSVLVVYPAENPVFQRAVLAFAEFLQWHGGCQVAIDMWQHGRLAEQGPMRWLADQAKSVARVMVVSPQPNHCHTGPGEHTVPAAAHDLFPLVLNMVASHAQSPNELAKFWLVHLGKAPERSGLPVELTSCREFSLNRDLEKLCRHLHQQGSRRPGLMFRSGLAYGEKATGKLKEAVQQLEAWQCSQPGGAGEGASLTKLIARL
ncbi:interleukin-17 receptor B isoform X1 [Salmo salar]|uniref:Interleukin-17 receptor B isoform X1 n=1 Tax=Salmo salar TaxID=8030 RepID=A0A1S3LHL4_SALSA|nr:interleukin-17 receptor B isoform X1 [Salmo salar]